MTRHHYRGPYADLAQQVHDKRQTETTREHERQRTAKQEWRKIAGEAKALAARASALPGPCKAWGLLFDAGELAEELGRE